MSVTLSLLLLIFLPPLAAAFTAQLVLSRGTRVRLRRWTAGLWVAALALVSSWDEGAGSVLGLVLFRVLQLSLAFLLSYCGALIGSMTALRLRLAIGRRQSRA